MPKLAINSIGKDRPGIVGAFTRVLYEHNCNIEDASMTILCGQFSMILIISGPDELNVRKLTEALKIAGDSLGLSSNINVLTLEDEKNGSDLEHYPYMICVSGGDQKGIAFKITEILSNYKVNITDFNSKLIGKDSKPVYVMMIETMIPETVDFEALKAELNKAAVELDVDLNLNEIECCDL